MIELLRWVQVNSAYPDLVKVAYEMTLAGSKVRQRMAEEVAYLVRARGSPYWSLNIFDGLDGFCADLAQSLVEYDTIDVEPAVLRMEWRKYMVGGGPEQHWVLAKEARLQSQILGLIVNDTASEGMDQEE